MKWVVRMLNTDGLTRGKMYPILSESVAGDGRRNIVIVNDKGERRIYRLAFNFWKELTDEVDSTVPQQSAMDRGEGCSEGVRDHDHG